MFTFRLDYHAVVNSPFLSQAEAKVAAQTLLAMVPSVRISFVMDDIMKLEPEDMMRVQRISNEKLTQNLNMVYDICSQRSKTLVLEAIREKKDLSYISPLKDSEKKTGRHLLNALSKKNRYIIEEHFLKEKPLEEIARISNCDIDDIRSSLNGTLRHLAFMMKKMPSTWVRLALDTTDPIEVILHLLEEREFFENFTFNPHDPIEYMINLLIAPIRDTYVMFYIDRLVERPKDFMNVTSEEVSDYNEGVEWAANIDKVVCTRMKRLIKIMLMRKNEQNSPRIGRRECQLTKRIFRKISKRHRDIYAKRLLSNSSEEDFADELGLDLKTVRKSIAKAKKSVLTHFVDELIRTLERQENEQKIGDRILERIKTEQAWIVACFPPQPQVEPVESQSKPFWRQSFPDDIMLEAGKVFQTLDQVDQHILAMHRGLGMDEYEAASILGMTPGEVWQRLKDIREQVLNIGIGLIGAEMKIETGSPNAPQMSESTRNFACKATFLMRDNELKLLEQYLFEDSTAIELADSFCLPVAEVERRLRSLQMHISTAMEIILTEWLRHKPNDETPAERIFRELIANRADRPPLPGALQEPSPDAP